MRTSPTDSYTLTLWAMGRPEKSWVELTSEEIARFEQEYAMFLKSDCPRAVYVLETEEKKRTIRLDLLTDYTIFPNTDD